jgi:phosphoesterase RecJ-like protein
MEREVYSLIKDFDSILIARHKNPDLDAYGSQFGLYYALKAKYPNKKIYAIGDDNNQNYFQELDKISDDIKKESLVFVLDTVAKQMLNEEDYLLHKKLVLIDHHQNIPDIEYDYYIRDVEASSTSEMVASFLLGLKIEINKESARALYMGIIGDTGRFMYNSTTPHTLKIASILLEKGINIQDIHDQIYLENLENKKIKAIFFNGVEFTKKNVAYKKNTQEFLDKYNLEANFVSRALISQMAGIEEVPVWANFTYDKKIDRILCEFRSRRYQVLDIAKQYGGGGHLYACGCSVKTWEEVDLIIKDLNKLVRKEGK